MSQFQSVRSQRIDPTLSHPKFIQFLMLFFGSEGKDHKRFLYKLNRQVWGPVMVNKNKEAQRNHHFATWYLRIDKRPTFKSLVEVIKPV